MKPLSHSLMERNKLPIFATAAMLILMGVGGRIALHDYPNFETVMVATFLAAMLLPASASLIVTITIMLLSDLYLGYFGTSKIIIFTYSGFVMVSLITSRYKKRIDNGLNVGSVYKFTASGVIFALVYDTWTNFGVFWLAHNHTLENLVLVYILGLPFMLYHLISSIVTFTLVGFPLYYLLASEVEDSDKHQEGNLISDE